MRFIVFPQCLVFLDAILSSDKFTKELAVPAFTEYVHKQQGLHWMAGASMIAQSVELSSGRDSMDVVLEN
jgi:hypothetical protein